MARSSGDRRLLIHIAILTIAAIFLGGGGVAYGINNYLVQLCALIILALNRAAVLDFWRGAPAFLRICVGLTLALPLIQLIPLPPAIWTSLPGRALVEESLNAIQLPLGWRPISLDQMRTLVAALGLITPLAVLMLCWKLSRTQLVDLGWIVVAAGLVAFSWGAIQVLSQGRVGIPYPENPMPGVLFASFANRNSAGAFFVICLSLALLLPRPGNAPTQRFAQAITVILFGLAILLTQSRSAIALAFVPVSIVAIGLLTNRTPNHRKLFVAGFIGLALSGLAIAGLLTNTQSRLGQVVARFSEGDGFRQMFWEDAMFAAQRYFPIGSGMGTFDEVFQIDESLEHLSARTAGRAHSDYLELAIEGGLPAILLLIMWIGLFLRWTWQAWRILPDSARPFALTGAVILLCIALHSIVDYPLRSQALLALAAFSVALFGRSVMLKGERQA